MRLRAPAVLAFSGPSGCGKTTLLVRLIPALVARGLRIAALKHSGHPHALDRPGKDSARLRRAGALAVAVQSPAELAWFGPPRPGGVRALVGLLPEVDLVVAEGFKDEPVPRVEVHRSAVAREFLCARDRRVVAVVSDVEPPRSLPWFTPGEVEPLAEFVARFTLRGSRARDRALASRKAHDHRITREASEPRESTMARTSNRKSTRRGRGSAGTRSRGGVSGSRKSHSGTGRRRSAGGATVREAGRKGGRRTLERRGPEFYSRIGRKGGKSSGARRGAAARARRAGGARGRATSGRRAGARRKSR